MEEKEFLALFEITLTILESLVLQVIPVSISDSKGNILAVNSLLASLNLFCSNSSALYALTTRIPVRFSLATPFNLSANF